MPITLIEGNKKKQGSVEGLTKLNSIDVAEFFCNTIQGEGISTGVPSAFLRVKGCTLDCSWCDTASVWREGDRYAFSELFELMEKESLIENFKNGQHLILTGGSPMKQQASLTAFLHEFIKRYKFKPYVEVENECTLMPTVEFEQLVDQWNNSPKLANSGMKERVRIKPLVLSHLGKAKNSWFKFVVARSEEWDEIVSTFIDTQFISKDQIILMPCGENQQELSKTRPIAAEMAIQHQVRFSDRLHVTIWDKKTGV